MKAYVQLRDQPVYRRASFVAGLGAAGHDVRVGPPPSVDADTLLVIWNRYDAMHALACRVEMAGGQVLVAENGYVGAGGAMPHAMKDRDVYAIARRFHNDSSEIRAGAPDRWAALGVDLAPWRADGDHVLVCPNRSFGTPGRIMPIDWPEKTARAVRAITRRPVRIRAHPGNDPHKVPLERDLDDCWAVVIWSSSVGVHALIRGVPVIACAPAWIALEAADRDLATVDVPAPTDRLSALRRLAWSQWHVDEIAAGVPFEHLVERIPELA